MRRIWTWTIALLLTLCILPGTARAAEVVAEGTCGAEGDNLTWVLTDDGVLTISGEGAMAEYSSHSEAPWYEYREMITELLLGEKITSLCRYGFRYFEKLEKIYFNATAMNDLADSGIFYRTGGDSPGVTVVIGANVTRIPSYLFSDEGWGADYGGTSNCNGITSVIFEEGSKCETIGNNAFSNCCSLNSIAIPESVTSIGNYAFLHCYNLLIQIEASALPETLGSYWDKGAAICMNVVKFGVTDYGQEYWITGDNTAHVWKYHGNDTTVVIPETIEGAPVVEIATSAFHVVGRTSIHPNARITYVEIPDSVTTINSFAFSSCVGLEKIIIPESVKHIGESAFSYCINVTEIGFNAIEMSNLESDSRIFSRVGEDVEGITVTIGANVTQIPDYLFYISNSDDAPNLTAVVFEEGSVCESIGIHAFHHCDTLSQIMLPESITIIGESAFYNCTGLTQIQIPENVTAMGQYAFYNCTGLSSIYYNATAMEDLSGYTAYPDAFAYAGTNGNGIVVTIGENVTYIPGKLFKSPASRCAQITEVVFEDGSQCTSIGSQAFDGCAYLTSISIPENVRDFGRSVFSECSGLISAGPVGNGYNIEFSWNDSIPSNTFSFSNLTEITLPDSVSSIGSYAFAYCKGLSGIDLPTELIAIGEMSFIGCSGLQEISIPEKVETIDNEAFKNCSALTEIVFNAVSMNDLTSYNEIFYNAGKDGAGIAVSIGANCSKLPAYLFCPYSSSYAPNITSVVFDENSNCRIIGGNAFAYLSLITEIEIPTSVTSIGTYAFRNCMALANITIPESVTSIDENVFYSCTNLNSAGSIGGGYNIEFGWTESIPANAFYGCTSLTEAVLPDSISDIGSHAFNGCSGLTEVTIPNGVASIADGTFYGCSNLTNVIIPDSVTSIGSNAFDHCTSLTDVYYGGSQEQWETISTGSFNSSLTSATIHFNSTGPEESPDDDGDENTEEESFYGNVKYFSEWDSENKIAYFGLNPLFGHKTCEDTNPEFYENAEKLVGHFVLVEETSMDNDFERFVINAYPVEERRGMVSTADATSIIIDGIPYTTPESMSFPQGYENKEVVYYLYDGQLVGIGSLQSEMGMLKSWDSETKRLVVDPEGLTDKSTLYVLSDLADEATIAFLGFTGQTHESVIYSYAGDFVYSMSSYLPPEGPDYYDTYIPMTEDEEQFFLLAEDWMRAYEEYISAVDKAMMALAGSDEETREEIISRQADAMQKSDRESTSQYLTGSLGAYSNEAYHALATFLYDYTCKNAEFSSVELSNNMAEINIINNVMKALWNEKQEYEYGRVKIAISAFGYGSTSMGQMTIHVNGNVYSSGIVICSSKSDCEEAVNAFVEELKDLATNASYNVASALYKDILGKSLSSLSTEYVSKAVTMLEKKFAVVLSEKFNKAGVGNVIHMLDECYTYYTWVYQAANSGNLDELPAAMAKVTGLKFEDSTIADGVSKAAVKLLRKASKAFLCAYEDYLEDLGSEGSAITGKALINCPVNVMVLNSSGEQIGYVGEDDIWYSDTIRICDIGGAKEIISYTDDLLTFEMCATGYGTMSCSFEEYESDGTLLGRLNFYNIPIEPDQTFSIALSEDYQANADTISIISGDMTIFADEYIDVADDGGVAIRCEVSGEGSISGVGTHVRGDAVVLNAVPAEGNVFLGWYEEESLLCISNTFEFTATKNRYLVAKFGAIDYYMVSVFSEEGGYVIGNGRYSPGELATIYAIPDNGFVFDGWYVNGECVSMNSEYTFSVASEMQLLGKFSRVGSEENAIIRIAGDDRIATSLMLADQLKEVQNVEKFDAVVVASALNFPDALTGSYLAAEKNAPILLTYPAAHAKIRAYIQENLKPGGMVYILGGEGAVSADFADGLSGFSVKRVAGSDRFGTNLAIMKEAGVSADQPVLIATATNFADSLSASAAGLPMVLVYGSLREDQKEFLATTSKNFIIIGGEAAVSKSLENELAAIGSVTRVAGSSRYETSVLVAERFVQNPDAVILAYARNFPDGLCGGPLAYALGAPLILTDSGAPGTADAYVENITAGIVVGGSGLISDSATRDIFDLAANAEIQTK